ncbi:proline-rich transmembrane protein 2-like [Crotalus tigris]|uniref:proline-rich transmembrane protein 2-like n=1 Tax=Crotalus tigris TaxID=88082 RepID=UPI00192F5580|nr:proline-rich transmembrane protein 2-like [Crotalus tigris]XP_039209802.1 proline-rich transmembrane protein 2-like [Crotalus tigris]XP_039209803.1 proline-rich transmembrane protein 2-like [Crotalus tigris]
MAEGTQGVSLAEGEVEAGDGVEAVPVPDQAAEQPVVRPKLLLAANPGPGVEETGAVKPQEEWWQSPALTGVQTGQPLTPKPKPSHSGWRERRVTSEDDEDWSYSTAPGQDTMEILRHRFGEASYRGASNMWQSEEDSAARTPSSRFRLSSPWLRLPPPAGGSALTGLPSGGPPGQPQSAQQAGSRNVARGPAVRGGVERQGPVPRYANIGSGQTLGPWGPGSSWGPPPIPVTFDGNPDHLAMFLGQAISHLDQYAQLYASQWTMVGAVTAALHGEAAAWAADLYSDHARELGSAGLFLDAWEVRRSHPSAESRGGPPCAPAGEVPSYRICAGLP